MQRGRADPLSVVVLIGMTAALCLALWLLWSAQDGVKFWLTKHRRLLKQGNAEAVIKQIRSLCRGGSKAIRTELKYLIKHQAHMAYDKSKVLGLPIGSGTIESAIRRVLNLRINGPAIYWNEESAEAIISLRSYFKAGRWDTLKTIALAPTMEVVA